MKQSLRIAIDCDSAAFELKKAIYEHIKEKGLCIEDLDYLKKEEADYPEIGHNLARRIQNGEFDRGILLCGTGLGMAMIANKVEGVYVGDYFTSLEMAGVTLTITKMDGELKECIDYECDSMGLKQLNKS